MAHTSLIEKFFLYDYYKHYLSLITTDTFISYVFHEPRNEHIHKMLNQLVLLIHNSQSYDKNFAL